MNFLKKIYYEKYTKKSYSISNVDLIINRMFSKINNGIYIDIGCNHPIKFNNTYLFIDSLLIRIYLFYLSSMGLHKSIPYRLEVNQLQN